MRRTKEEREEGIPGSSCMLKHPVSIGYDNFLLSLRLACLLHRHAGLVRVVDTTGAMPGYILVAIVRFSFSGELVGWVS